MTVRNSTWMGRETRMGWGVPWMPKAFPSYPILSLFPGAIPLPPDQDTQGSHSQGMGTGTLHALVRSPVKPISPFSSARASRGDPFPRSEDHLGAAHLAATHGTQRHHPG